MHSHPLRIRKKRKNYEDEKRAVVREPPSLSQARMKRTTGLPQTFPTGVTKPVRKSSYSPVAAEP